jgi:hypothetical protein
MKHIKLRTILAATASLILLGSCNDYLDILPTNDVVLDNFWKEKADVSSVLNGCYESLEQSDCLNRFAIWGELRSDNIIAGNSTGFELSEILKENILPTNSYCTWQPVYRTINRCNTVIHYAPHVHQVDPNYTMTEMNANIAEASALRDLCYFYLIRTFRDVPYSTQPSVDDTEDYILPATPFSQVLDSLITDLENVKDYAVRRYYLEENELAYYNSSRITRWAIYAMLADMYLWKGDYDNCIKYCDYIIDYKKQQYKDLYDRNVDVTDIKLFNGVPLIVEQLDGNNTCGHAYNEIFGKGNSFESIFELYFRDNQSVTNSYVSNYYGDRSNDLRQFSAPDFLYKNTSAGTNDIFKKRDCRAYEDIKLSSSKYAICKYARQSVSFRNENLSTDQDLRLSDARRSNNYANWIIYRLTDVMLMKAEAEVMKGDQFFKDAFSLVNAVNKRAVNVTTTAVKDTLVYADYASSQRSMEDLVFQERHRETLFEGKRWFDLVRLARRDGNNNRLISLVSNKYEDNVNAIKIKLADPNILYFPYSRNELKVNPKLVQNPAYSNSEQTKTN